MELLELKNKLTYPSPMIKTPFFSQVKILFADDTATGRPAPYVDKMIEKNILPYCSNTHSNAFCGTLMSEYIDKTRAYIKEQYKLDKYHKVFFSGNGATGASNHLVSSIDTDRYKDIYIYITIFEHHSNYLPWYELARKKKNIHIFIIPLDKYDEINLVWLDKQIQNNNNEHNLNIVSITACSNVTGIITDYRTIYGIVNKYNIRKIKNNFLIIDCATLAPYKLLDGMYFDGAFISGHKFMGGTGSPGILVAHEELFKKGCPYAPGGGCVISADLHQVVYDTDLERKESAGTPNIIGIIRFFYAMQLRDNLLDIIGNNEKYITNYVHNFFTKFTRENTDVNVIYLNKNLDHRLPILSLYSKTLHYNFIVILLNDLFGIQSRGGVSCAGMFGQYLNEKTGLGGWTRITFSWWMSQTEIDYILNAISIVLTYGNMFKKYYSHGNNMFYIKKDIELDADTKKLLQLIKKNLF
jgi:selenocysteine lyase/cysteine desulfurase